MNRQNPTSAESHFAFGKNWASYANTIDQTAVTRAKEGILNLLARDQIAGRSFLDIGCGSGIHSLAAAQLGASRILAVDIDKDSVETTRSVLKAFGCSVPWQAEVLSIFDLNAARFGQFDTVYSWGVLHHTGDMLRGISMAAELVAPGGLFAFALYRRTYMDWFWRVEKRWYAHASPRSQEIVRSIYLRALKMRFKLAGRDFSKHVTRRDIRRGMNFDHDLHDWLGGYPYEAISPGEVDKLMVSLGLTKEKVVAPHGGKAIGLTGSGCDEYVYARPPATSSAQ